MASTNESTGAVQQQQQHGERPQQQQRHYPPQHRGPPQQQQQQQQHRTQYQQQQHPHQQQQQRGPPNTAVGHLHAERRLPHQQPITTTSHPATNVPPSSNTAVVPPPAAATIHSKFENLAQIVYPFVDECFQKYDRLEKIGQGTFGEVFKAKDKATGAFVALKKILMDNEKEGFPITALREIKILQLVNQVSCENVVKLIEICRTRASAHNRWRSTFYLVFEFADHDLAGILSNQAIRLSVGHQKTIMKQLFEALFFIHTNKIIHRDMKAANVLITNAGTLKLADFGLARLFTAHGTAEKPNRFTNRVVTLWYRPPELLLGDRNYGPAIDMWGAGCIMAELWTRNPILQGNTEFEQVLQIITLCGSINEDVYPGCSQLEYFNKFLDLPKNKPRELITTMSTKHGIKDPIALDLLDKLFTINPTQRIKAEGAVDHDWFWSGDVEESLSAILTQHRQSNFEYTTQQERHRAYQLHQQQRNAAAAVSAASAAAQQQQQMHPAGVGGGGDAGGGPIRHGAVGTMPGGGQQTRHHYPPQSQQPPQQQQQVDNQHNYAPSGGYAGGGGQRNYNNSRVNNRHHPYGGGGGGNAGGGRPHHQNYAGVGGGGARPSALPSGPSAGAVNPGGMPYSNNNNNIPRSQQQQQQQQQQQSQQMMSGTSQQQQQQQNMRPSQARDASNVRR